MISTLQKSGAIARCLIAYFEAFIVALAGRRVCQICEGPIIVSTKWSCVRICIKGKCTLGHSRHTCSRCLSAFQSSSLIEVHLALKGINSDQSNHSMRCISIAPYVGTAREAICALKYFGKVEITRDLACVLERGLHELVRASNQPLSNYVIVPVPLHRDKLKQRSFNQSELLATLLAKRSGIKCDTRALIRSRATVAQYGLTKLKRAANVSGAFSASHSKVKDRSIILIDDVLTSGATAIACGEALLEAGASSVQVLSLARAILRSES